MSLNKIHFPYNDLKHTKELVYDQHGLVIKDLLIHPEGSNYSACSYQLNGKVIEYRKSKITPSKTGQFVTIWKRTKEGITRPFNSSDNLDFIIISSFHVQNFGLFIFPKSVLEDKGIISHKGKEGKRGIRVYPAWDIVKNKQAEKTQSWQIRYFQEVKNSHLFCPELIKAFQK